jgi:SAM-dependent methyltransferase
MIAVTKLFMNIVRNSPLIRKGLWRLIYELIPQWYGNRHWRFMNYGYASLDEPKDKFPLDEKDERNRYFIQLYHHAIGAIDLKECTVVEIGCGRGGGSDYINRYLQPKHIVGVDYSYSVIKFCNHMYNNKGLSFMYGDAESLPFENSHVDAVINVESSHCYVSKEKFFNEVERILKPGGYFFYTDVCDADEYETIRRQLFSSPMMVIKEEDITANVIQALELDGARRLNFFKRTLPKLFSLTYFREFTGDKGSAMYRKFKTGKIIYFCYTLRKPA